MRCFRFGEVYGANDASVVFGASRTVDVVVCWHSTMERTAWLSGK
jgi:hypothetical protein